MLMFQQILVGTTNYCQDQVQCAAQNQTNVTDRGALIMSESY